MDWREFDRVRNQNIAEIGSGDKEEEATSRQNVYIKTENLMKSIIKIVLLSILQVI